MSDEVAHYYEGESADGKPHPGAVALCGHVLEHEVNEDSAIVHCSACAHILEQRRNAERSDG